MARVPQPHQRGWLFQAIHFSPAALWAKIAGMERGVCDCNFISTGKRRGPLAPMTGRADSPGLRFACCIRQNGAEDSVFRFRTRFSRHGLECGFLLLAFGFA